MTWDKTLPLGSEDRSNGATRIREMKTDLQTALQTDGTFPGPTPATPVFYHKFPSGNTAARPAAGNTGRWYWNTQTKTIQRDTGSAWEDLTPPNDLIPANKKMVFYNVAAPTGWTQDTTYNDRIIRIVVGTGGGSGGTDSISSPPSHSHGGVTGENSSLAHTHAIVSSQTTVLAGAPVNAIAPAAGTVSEITGTSGALLHTHSISAAVGFSPKYADVIICYRA